MCPGEPPLGPCQATRRIKEHATPGVPGKGEGTAKPLRGGVAFGCGSSGVASWVKEGSAGPVKLAPPFSDSVTDGLPPLRASNPTLSLWGRPEEAGGHPARVLGPAPRLGWGSVFGSLPGGLVSPRPKLVGAGPPPPPSGGGGLPLVLHGRCLLSRFSPLPSSLPLFSSFRFHLRSAFALSSGRFSSFSSPAVGVFVSFFRGNTRTRVVSLRVFRPSAIPFGPEGVRR